MIQYANAVTAGTDAYVPIWWPLLSTGLCQQRVDLRDDGTGLSDVILQGSIVFNVQLYLYLRPHYTHYDILEETALLMSSTESQIS